MAKRESEQEGHEHDHGHHHGCCCGHGGWGHGGGFWKGLIVGLVLAALWCRSGHMGRCGGYGYGCPMPGMASESDKAAKK